MLISLLLFVNIRAHSWLKFFECGSFGTEINETLENAEHVEIAFLIIKKVTWRSSK